MISALNGDILWSHPLPGFFRDFKTHDGHLVLLMSPATDVLDKMRALLVSKTGIIELGPAEWTDITVDNHVMVGHVRDVVVYNEFGNIKHIYDIANTSMVTTQGDQVAFALDSGMIEVLEKSGKRIALLAGNTGSLCSLVFTHDGKYLVSIGQDGYTRIWDILQSSELFHYVGLDGIPDTVKVDRAAKRILVNTEISVQLYPFDDPSARLVIELPEHVGPARFVAGGSRLFTASDTGVEVWDATTGERLNYVAGKVANNAHVDPDLRIAAFNVDEEFIPMEVRDLRSGALRARIRSERPIWAISFDRTGTRIATTNSGGKIEIWTIEGKRLTTIPAHRNFSFQIEFSADNKMLLSGGHDHTAAIWEVSSGNELGRVRQEDMIWTARFDPTAVKFATGGSDKYAMVWDTRTFLPIRAFQHEASVRAVALNGSFLAGATLTNAIQLWDISSGREANRYHHTGIVQSLDFNGDRMLSAGFEGRIVIWDVSTSVGTPQEVVSFVCKLLGNGDLAARNLLQCPAASTSRPGAR